MYLARTYLYGVSFRSWHRAGAYVDLVAAGASVTDAASRLGIRVDYAARLVHDELSALPAQHVDDLRAVTELRLDRLATTYSALMDSNDERTRLVGANGLLAVERDRVRLLGTWQKPPREDD